MSWRLRAPSLYALAALGIFGAVLPALGHSWIGIDADAKQMVYWLDLVAKALSDGSNPLVTRALHAPGGVNLMWNTSLVLPGILLAPLTRLAGPFVSYNALVAAAPVLSAWAAFAALRRYTHRPVAAWLGGLVYGFSPALIAESLGHAQVSLAWYPPVVLLLLHECLVRRTWSRWRLGALLGAATAAQLLSGEEMVLSTAVIAAFGVGILALQQRRGARAVAGRLVAVLAVAGAVAVLLAGAPLAVQFAGPYTPVGRLVPSGFVVSDAGAFLVPASRQLLHLPGVSSDPWSIVTEDAGAYIGVPMMLLLLGAWRLLRRTSAAVAWAVPLVLTTSILALGPQLHFGGNTTAFPLPWMLFDRIPFLEDIDPARFMVVAWLGVAVVVAAWVDHVLVQPPRRRRWASALIAVALLSLMPAAAPVTRLAVPAYFTSADAATIPDGDTVLIAPLSPQASLRVLLWQVQAGLRWRMVGGNAYGQGRIAYFTPSSLTDAMATMESGTHGNLGSADLHTMRADLRQLGVGTVIVLTGEPQASERELMRWLLGPETYSGGGVAVWHDVRTLVSRAQAGHASLLAQR